MRKFVWAGALCVLSPLLVLAQDVGVSGGFEALAGIKIQGQCSIMGGGASLLGVTMQAGPGAGVAALNPDHPDNARFLAQSKQLLESRSSAGRENFPDVYRVAPAFLRDLGAAEFYIRLYIQGEPEDRERDLSGALRARQDAERAVEQAPRDSGAISRFNAADASYKIAQRNMQEAQARKEALEEMDARYRRAVAPMNAELLQLDIEVNKICGA